MRVFALRGLIEIETSCSYLFLLMVRGVTLTGEGGREGEKEWPFHIYKFRT